MAKAIHTGAIDLRRITVSIVVAVLYAMARWVRLPESVRESELRHIYTWVASSLAADHQNRLEQRHDQHQ
jgi:hypothetical protein